MNNNIEFPLNFKAQLKQNLTKLEPLRKQTKLKIIIAFIPFVLKILVISGGLSYGLLWAVLTEFKTSNNDYEILLAGFIGLLFIWGVTSWLFFLKKNKIYYIYLYQGDYFLSYKKQVVNKMIEIMGRDMVYNHDEGISQEIFKNSGFPLFANPSGYYSSDSITGKIKETTFTFSEVLAEQIIDHETGNRSDLFRGIFFVADFHKKTNWNTIVYPDAFKYFSKFLVGNFSEEKDFKRNNYQRIKLEDVEFEKYFEVYGTSQVESRYILSPALMARMVNFKKRTNKSIQVSFKNSTIYFGIHYSNWKNLFKPPLFSSIQNISALESYFSDINLMLEVIKEINFNSNFNEK